MADEIASKQELNATQLDAQRARHLLDRALGLSERDDIAGAIVICRQALALSPRSPQGWSMLGLLHERDHDIDGAIQAYEKALALSPGSMVERESLQRLRKQRGGVPRRAPKFNFDGVGTDLPQVPSALRTKQSGVKPLEWEGFGSNLNNSLWNTFYFRSLPLAVTTVICLGALLIAQGVAANRPATNARTMVAPPVKAEVNDVAKEAAPPQPAPSTVLPSALEPLISEQQEEETNVPGATVTSSQPDVPAPVIEKKPVTPVKPKPKPKPAPKPKASAPTEMPILPPPRLNLPQRNAPAPITPKSETGGNGATNEDPLVGGGPVDVGNSEDDTYILIQPPHFPNASRNQR